MMKKVFLFFLALAVVVVFSLSVLAQEVVTGKIQAIDKVAKKVHINGKEYSLSDEAAQTEFKKGDEVEATKQGTVVKKLSRVLQ